jgi:REP element-mobilizing transposase RayT
MPQSLSKLYVHLIFSTRHREPLLMSSVRSPLRAYLATVLKSQDCPALKIGGTSDHAHILFRLSKNLALAEVVEKVKTSSSSGLRPRRERYGPSTGRTATAAFP